MRGDLARLCGRATPPAQSWHSLARETLARSVQREAVR